MGGGGFGLRSASAEQAALPYYLHHHDLAATSGPSLAVTRLKTAGQIPQRVPEVGDLLSWGRAGSSQGGWAAVGCKPQVLDTTYTAATLALACRGKNRSTGTEVEHSTVSALTCYIFASREACTQYKGTPELSGPVLDLLNSSDPVTRAAYFHSPQVQAIWLGQAASNMAGQAPDSRLTKLFGLLSGTFASNACYRERSHVWMLITPQQQLL